MNPERWRRIDELFRTVAEQPTAERAEYLTRVCGDDADLRREVLELLDHDPPDSFLQDPIKQATLAVTNEPADELLGRHIGPYRLTRLIGRGGMGAVYEAVRDDDQFQQRVALKVIKRGMDSDFVRERFLRERQILASLDHPHIARLFDGGATADGLPYFVMEFVEGVPITDYCRGLSLDAKLKLFRDVCSAVQHAHQKLVVHRDLKPSNILVTAEGAPKLLDFGIAKLLSPDPGEAVTRTETVMRLMTPDYASPEQVRGSVITTVSDVYSLGVVLYELLTARRPHQFDTYSPAAIEHAICDTEAPRPSDVVARMKEGMRDEGGGMKEGMRDEGGGMKEGMRDEGGGMRDEGGGIKRGMRDEGGGMKVRSRKFFSSLIPHPSSLIPHPSSLIPHPSSLLRGDLDNIVMMALRKEPERRYRSVEQFSEDLRRYLSGLPITARPDTFVYRTSKFVRRHRVEVAFALTVVALLIGIALAMTVQAARTARERDRANQAAAAAEAVTQSLISIFDFAERGMEKAETSAAKKLLDQNTDHVLRELKAQPVIQARLMDTIGILYANLLEFERAQSLLDESLKLRRQHLGAEHTDVATSLFHLGLLARKKGDAASAEALLRQSLHLRRKLLDGAHPDVAESASRLGELLVERGQFAEAEVLLREALALVTRQHKPVPKVLTNTLASLAQSLSKQGKSAEAMDLCRQSPALYRRSYGSEYPTVAVKLASIASVLYEAGDRQGAETMLRELLAEQRAQLGSEHPDVVFSLFALADVLRDKREFPEAIQLLRQIAALERKQFGANSAELSGALNNLGYALNEQGNYAEAESFFRQALAIDRQILGETHPLTATEISNLAEVNFNRGQFKDALQLYRQALDIFLKSHHPDHWIVVRTRSYIGGCLTKLKRYNEAEEQLLSAHRGLKTVRGENHEETRKSVSRLIELYEVWGKPDRAAPYRVLPRVNE